MLILFPSCNILLMMWEILSVMQKKVLENCPWGIYSNIPSLHVYVYCENSIVAFLSTCRCVWQIDFNPSHAVVMLSIPSKLYKNLTWWSMGNSTGVLTILKMLFII